MDLGKLARAADRIYGCRDENEPTKDGGSVHSTTIGSRGLLQEHAYQECFDRKVDNRRAPEGAGDSRNAGSRATTC